MSFSGTAVARPPALIRDQVAAQIREAITELRLMPGQVLVERELCETTTASRATVREALRQLESEGLVSSTNGRGTVVATLSVEDARQIYEVRSALEGMAGRLFAERASDQERRTLRAALLHLEEVADDTRQLSIAKTEFYGVLVGGAQNIELKQILDSINRRVTLVRVVSLLEPGRAKQSIAEVQAICDAAVSGDGARAEELCRRHVENAAAAALPRLAEGADLQQL
ncbi:GntR family transcriptional regulator [Streptomyces sp. NPDC050560]|uniref:GntR family transcriptional regulator n=1 Tax=Streptomyces sp. NPDC050560 TaxID=3365630 RepID=UPI0037BA0036